MRSATTTTTLLLVALALLSLGAPARAQDVGEPWTVGQVAVRDEGASWWWRVQPDGSLPEVRSEPEGLATVWCPARPEEPQSCTLLAWGPWRRVVVDGVVVGERSRLRLPLIARARQHPAGGREVGQ